MPYPVNSNVILIFIIMKPVNVIKINKYKSGQRTVKFEFKGLAV